MSDNNCCRDNYSSPSLRNSCRVPVTSPIPLHSTEVNCGSAPCSPSSSLGSHVAHDNCQDLYGERRSFQYNTCERDACSPSSYSPTISGVPGVYQGTSCLPSTSQSSGFCHPASSRQRVRYHFPSYQSYGYQPQGYLACGRQPLRYLTWGRQPLSHLTCANQPLSYLPYDGQPLRYLPNGCQPLTYMPDYYRPTNYTCSNFQPYSSSSNWSSPY
ncbi:keratin-associated protein 26-1-like [Perognathus longimembris pacificus]|uniref:keratin-associated protein 26-1-like n=1 Tax=Perognathus longimembris pacificus TaxID=214514 RepID=UPI002018AAC3|nr:keratin-associated protein 26-1-like [Perognathus longimembris pacificus]